MQMPTFWPDALGFATDPNDVLRALQVSSRGRRKRFYKRRKVKPKSATKVVVSFHAMDGLFFVGNYKRD